jgi:hypothetical protein
MDAPDTDTARERILVAVNEGVGKVSDVVDKLAPGSLKRRVVLGGVTFAFPFEGEGAFPDLVIEVVEELVLDVDDDRVVRLNDVNDGGVNDGGAERRARGENT